MSKYWTDTFSFVTGVIRNKELACLSLIGDNESKNNQAQSIISVWQEGEWFGDEDGDKNWSTVDSTIAKQPLEQALMLGPKGQVYCLGSGDEHEEKITNGIDENSGDFRGIRGIGDCVFAVGMNRQVYRRNIQGDWLNISSEALTDNNSAVVGFESIDGFNEKDIYTVGFGGEIWHCQDDIWTQINSPTDLVLSDVCCAENGYVYACGLSGCLLKGKDGHWQVIEHNSIVDDIWNMVWYEGNLYLSTLLDVYRLNDDESISLVEMGKDTPNTCFHLRAADGVLWSIGAKDVMAFDGTNWSRID